MATDATTAAAATCSFFSPRKRRKRRKRRLSLEEAEAEISREKVQQHKLSTKIHCTKLLIIAPLLLSIIYTQLILAATTTPRAASAKPESQAAQRVQFKLPAGASCKLHPLSASVTFDSFDETELTKEFDFVKAPDRLADLLAQRAEVSVQDKSKWVEGRNDTFIQYQSAFSSICQGWRNSLPNRVSLHQPDAYWVLDELRGALVAKFLYTDKLDWLEARLTSPIFHPIPPYHSQRDSRYFGSCRAQFSAYLTIDAHLELNLIPVPTTISSQQTTATAAAVTATVTAVSTTTTNSEGANMQQPLEQQLEHSQITLKSVREGKVSRGRQVASQGGERAVWAQYSVLLPTNMSQLYKLEFSAMPGSIVSASTALDYKHLNGVAIANFSLSPQCFGLGVDQTELARFNYSPPASWSVAADGNSMIRNGPSLPFQRRLAHLFDANKTSIFVCVILFLVLVVAASQYLICYHLGPCCNRGRQRKRIYASEMQLAASHKRNNTHLKGAAANGRGFGGGGAFTRPLIEQHLRPIRVAFDDVELNDNPNYLQTQINGSDYLPKPESVPLEPYRIDRKRLQMIKPLGKGAFGEVYQGRLMGYCTDNPSDPDGQILLRDSQLEARTRDELERFESHWISVAVKTLTDERMTEREFIQEAHNMSLVDHRNIVELIGVCFEEKPPYIVMELLPGGNLKNFLLKNRDKGHNNDEQIVKIDYYQNDQDPSSNQHNHSPWSPPNTPRLREENNNDSSRVKLCMGDLLVFALDIARACDYLQQKQFIHRDLAARNCLLTSAFKNFPSKQEDRDADDQQDYPTSGRSFVGYLPSALDVNANHKVDFENVFLNGYRDSGIVAKLADFGMTRDVYTNDYYRLGHKELPVRWMPPECLDGVATTKSDVWSFGVFLWELMSMGQMPYQDLLDNRQVIEFIKSRRHKKPSRFLSTQSQTQPLQSQSRAQPLAQQSTSATNYQRQASERHLMALSAHIDENTDHSALRLLPLPGESCTDLYAAASFTTAACDQSNSLLIDQQQQPHASLVTANGHLTSSEPQVASGNDSPPLPLPHDNTPHSIYAIMCACWATNPDERPQFYEIANRLYWCLQKEDVLSTSLPCFYE